MKGEIPAMLFSKLYRRQQQLSAWKQPGVTLHPLSSSSHSPPSLRLTLPFRLTSGMCLPSLLLHLPTLSLSEAYQVGNTSTVSQGHSLFVCMPPRSSSARRKQQQWTCLSVCLQTASATLYQTHKYQLEQGRCASRCTRVVAAIITLKGVYCFPELDISACNYSCASINHIMLEKHAAPGFILAF